MKISKSNLRNFAAASVLATGFAAITPVALAQNTEDSVDEEQDDVAVQETVVITGSRIQRKDFVSPSPLVTVGIEQIEDSGKTTLDDYLRELPQFAPGSGDFSNDSNAGAAPRATLNLRGLGAERNLVIMDGRRLMSSNADGAIDINTLPSLAIGSVEVITGGASATYGSDAMSGVVNFKSRTNLDGLEVSAQYNDPDRGGEGTYNLGAAYGKDFADGKGNFIVAAEYVDRGGIRILDREFFANPNQSSFTPQNRFLFATNTAGQNSDAIGLALLAAQGTPATPGFNPTFFSVNDDGTIYSQEGSFGYTGPTTLPWIISEARGNRVGYHPTYFNFIQVPLERLALFGKTEYEVSSNVTAYAQATYSSSEASGVGSQPIAATATPLFIPATNPYFQALPNGVAALADNGVTRFQARLAEFGPRNYQSTVDTWQILLGAKGTLEGRDLNWDIHASYGGSKSEDLTTSGAVSSSALNQLLAAPDGGDSICAGGYNPFSGTAPGLSQECIEFAGRSPLNETEFNQFVAEGVLEGRAFDMPAGEARFALTGHHRTNSFDFDPDPELASRDLPSLAGAGAARGDISVTEVAGEVFLPLIADSFVNDANLTLGYRHSEYNLAGGADTFKVEFDAALNDNFLFRAGYQRAIRAPNLNEAFSAGLERNSQIGTPPNGGDPCDNRAFPTGEVLALCVLQGVPLDASGTNTDHQQGTGSTPTLTVGSTELEPETSDSFTVGGVFNMDLGGSQFTVSVDYYNIEIEGAIAPIAAGDTLQRCFNGAGTNPTFDPNNFFCQQITRDPLGSGNLQLTRQPTVNLGALNTSGIDIAAEWSMPVDALAWGGGDGAIELTTNINLLDKFEEQAQEGDPFFDFAGTIDNDAFPRALFYPEQKAQSTVRVISGPLSVLATWRHLSSMDDRTTALDPTSTIEGVPSYDTFDLTGRYELNDHFEFYAGVNNLTDEDPLVVGGTNSTTNIAAYDPIGRTFFFGAKARY